MSANNDLIKLSDLQKFPIRIDHYDRVNGSEEFVSGAESVIEYAENLPRVDAEPVRHGRWLKTCLPDVFACSECRKPTKMDELCSSRTLRGYCPNCGAKMDAEVES